MKLIEKFNEPLLTKVLQTWILLPDVPELRIGDLTIAKKDYCQIYYDGDIIGYIPLSPDITHYIITLLKRCVRCESCENFQIDYHYDKRICDKCICNMCMQKPDDNCCICMEKLNTRATKELPCNHHLHIACEQKMDIEEEPRNVLNFLYRKCPLCRQKYYNI